MVFGNAAFDNQAHALRVQTALRSHRPWRCGAGAVRRVSGRQQEDAGEPTLFGGVQPGTGTDRRISGANRLLNFRLT